MVSGIDERLRRLWTQPGQTPRGRVNHRTREPLLHYCQTSSKRVAGSCLAVNIIVIIMKLWNCRFSVIKGGSAASGRRDLELHAPSITTVQDPRRPFAYSDDVTTRVRWPPVSSDGVGRRGPGPSSAPQSTSTPRPH